MNRLRRKVVLDELGFVACEIGTATYAASIEVVQEIIRPAPLSPLPDAPLGFIGAIDHRGEIVPILDLGLRLGLGETRDPRRKWILLRLAGRHLGLVVARVCEVFRVERASVRAAPSLGPAARRISTEVVTFREDLAYVFDPEALRAFAELPVEPP